MKKTKLMRAALLLLVLTLITSCFVGGTFAKYTTRAEGSDTARVAKWGFQPTTITMTDLFKTAYDATDNATVKSTVDVIAPGTTGSAKFGFTYGGDTNATAPEVAYTFEVSTTGSECADSIKNNLNIKWRLDNGDWGTWDKLLAAINKLDGDKTYAPGELPAAFSAAGNNEHTVEWQWVYHTTNEADVKDTDMGNAVELANVTLKITVAATQVD